MGLNICVNDFVKRQTAESRFSHFNGSWDDLVDMVWWNWANSKPGYTDGVMLVNIPCDNFYSGIVQLKSGDKLSGGFEPRREGETPRKFVTSSEGQKAPAANVDIVLYSSSLLAREGDNQLPDKVGNWEIISINASPTSGEMPIDPVVLMHNHFGSDGGTETGLSDTDFVKMLKESFCFWKDKVMCG